MAIIRYVVRLLLHRYCFTRGRSRLTAALQRWLPSNGALDVRGFDSTRITLDLSQFPSQQFYWFGAWESADARVLCDQLRAGMVAFDVGANVGIVTLTMARLVANDGHIHAFEPEPSNFRLLTKNVSRNGFKRSVTLNQVALSDQSGSANLNRSGDAASAYVSDELAASGAIEVHCTTIDTYARLVGLSRLDLIKIDVEGAEMRVLRGATATLRRFRPVLLVECAERHLHRSGVAARDLLGLLAGLGYKSFVPSVRRLRWVNVDASDANIPGNDNLVCLPADFTDSSWR